MTQLERMQAGLIYDTCDKEIMELQRSCQEKLWKFNQLNPFDAQAKEAYMKEMFAECGDFCCIELPLRASWGGAHVHLGHGVYANFNLTLIDDGNIYIGNRVLFGPNVVVATANHTLNPELRRYEMQYVRDVHIGDNVWIGAGAVILPGVNIGNNSVIAAGSVVSRDIPENVLAIGVPCRVSRTIGEHEHNFYSNLGIRIDWENIEDICEAKSNLPKFK